MADPTHLVVARRYLGLKEIPGPKSEPLIVKMWAAKDAWLGTDDSKVAWCGAFLRFVFEDNLHIAPPKAYYRARAWLDWGRKSDVPCVGAVVVFERGGSGHVAIIDGQDNAGNLRCIGGNQGDKVCYAYFPRDRVLGYRIPPGMEIPPLSTLPVFARAGALSTNEA